MPSLKEMVISLLEKYTQEELAAMVGSNQTTISNIKNNDNFKVFYNVGKNIESLYVDEIESGSAA